MKICIIGSGYVGLVSGSCFSDLGNNVICVDNNLDKIKSAFDLNHNMSNNNDFEESFMAGTTTVQAADTSGWIVSITPSGGWIPAVIAGNTGIGLGLVGNSLGFKTIIVMPETQSQEKKDALNLIGCELRLVPAKPYKDENNFVKIAGRLADELRPTNNNGVVWANQFDNVANAKGHLLYKIYQHNLVYKDLYDKRCIS